LLPLQRIFNFKPIHMILVTGGSGLVGGCLLEELVQQAVPVKAIYRKQIPVLKNKAHEKITWVETDILDVVGLEEAMNGVTQLYHAAAIVSFNPRRRAELMKINVEGTANVVNAALDAGVQKMVYVSSVAALGRIREGQTITEEMNWSPETSNSAYGESKYLGEMEVWRGIAEGLDAVMVNPSMILGAGDWNKSSTKIFKTVYEEFPWYTDGVTGWVDVRDVADAMMSLMNSDITEERFILSADNRSFKDMFALMSTAFGKKPAHRKVTPFLGGLVWRWEALKSRFTGNDPLVTKETAKTAQAHVYFSNQKLTKMLPTFQYRNLEQTVREICADVLVQNLKK
jgi:dihydroflavonol-4-reductase